MEINVYKRAWRELVIRDCKGFNQKLLIELSNLIDNAESLVALMDYTGDNLNKRNYHAGYNNVLSYVFHKVGVYFCPPSKAMDDIVTINNGNDYSRGMLDATAVVNNLLIITETNNSSEFYVKKYKGEQCKYMRIGDIITVKVDNPITRSQCIGSPEDLSREIKVQIQDFAYDHNTQGKCKLYNQLKLAKCSNGKWYNVANCPETDCDICIKLNK